MNKKLVKNILLYQAKEQELDKDLLNHFNHGLIKLIDFLIKESNKNNELVDLSIIKEQTREKINENKDLKDVYQNLIYICYLNSQITRETKFKVLKHLISDTTTFNPSAICIYSLHSFWPQNIKLLKSQQKSIIELFKDDTNKGKYYTRDGLFVLMFLKNINLLKSDILRENMKGFKFENYHELNKGSHIDFNKLTGEQFIKYISEQFETYKLKLPMSLQKNDISLKEAVSPYLIQNISQDKKDILSTFLNLIRPNLDLDNENNQFLDNFILNTKLSKTDISNKAKIPKI